MKLFGINAVAARRAGIGTPVVGQGSICQNVESADWAKVQKLATEMGSSNAKVREENRARGIAVVTSRIARAHSVRRRMVTEESISAVRAILKATKGNIPHHVIIASLHGRGLGCTNELVAAERARMNYPTDCRVVRRALATPSAAARKIQAGLASVAAATPADPLVQIRALSTGYLRECVVEWNRRVTEAQAALDLATDPLTPAKFK